MSANLNTWQVNTTGDPDTDLVQSFRFCHEEERHSRDGEKFTFIFYPTALLVSSFFLLLTLLAYSLDPDLHRPLFGKVMNPPLLSKT